MFDGILPGKSSRDGPISPVPGFLKRSPCALTLRWKLSLLQMVRAIDKTQLSYFRPISSDTKGLLFIEDIVSVLLLYSLVYGF